MKLLSWEEIDDRVAEFKKKWTSKKGARIGLCAKEVLNCRDNHPNSSLADLYDPLTMPADLLKTHKNLDKAVMELYGYPSDMTEPEIVADLMVRYQKLVEAESANTVNSRKSKDKA